MTTAPLWESQEENILKQSRPEALPNTVLLPSDLSQGQERIDQVIFLAQNLPIATHELLNKIWNLHSVEHKAAFPAFSLIIPNPLHTYSQWAYTLDSKWRLSPQLQNLPPAPLLSCPSLSPQVQLLCILQGLSRPSPQLRFFSLSSLLPWHFPNKQSFHFTAISMKKKIACLVHSHNSIFADIQYIFVNLRSLSVPRCLLCNLNLLVLTRQENSNSTGFARFLSHVARQPLKSLIALCPGGPFTSPLCSPGDPPACPSLLLWLPAAAGGGLKWPLWGIQHLTQGTDSRALQSPTLQRPNSLSSLESPWPLALISSGSLVSFPTLFRRSASSLPKLHTEPSWELLLPFWAAHTPLLRAHTPAHGIG